MLLHSLCAWPCVEADVLTGSCVFRLGKAVLWGLVFGDMGNEEPAFEICHLYFALNNLGHFFSTIIISLFLGCLNTSISRI